MNTEDVLRLYMKDLVEYNKQLSTATSPEYNRLLEKISDAEVVVESLSEVVEKEKEQSPMKVYQITMFEQHEHCDVIKDIIVALGSDEYTACKYVFGNLGYDIMKEVKDVTFRVVEVEGPFGQGSLLYRHKVIND